jgi:putative transcriptional regulator
MQLRAGIFLKSTEALADTLFEDSIIFITEYNKDGAVGFIINKPFGRSLNELVEFRHSIPFPLYSGGPVDSKHLFFIHSCANIIKEGKPVTSEIYSGGNFSQAVTAINNKTIGSNDIKIFVGYCGWDGGELEAEVEEGSWETVQEKMFVFQ